MVAQKSQLTDRLISHFYQIIYVKHFYFQNANCASLTMRSADDDRYESNNTRAMNLDQLKGESKTFRSID